MISRELLREMEMESLEKFLSELKHFVANRVNTPEFLDKLNEALKCYEKVNFRLDGPSRETYHQEFDRILSKRYQK